MVNPCLLNYIVNGITQIGHPACFECVRCGEKGGLCVKMIS